jgi:hypothetical protein
MAKHSLEQQQWQSIHQRSAMTAKYPLQIGKRLWQHPPTELDKPKRRGD